MWDALLQTEYPQKLKHIRSTIHYAGVIIGGVVSKSRVPSGTLGIEGMHSAKGGILHGERTSSIQ